MKKLLWLAAAFTGLVVLAAVISICLWYLHEINLAVYTLSYQGGTLSTKDRTYKEAFDLELLDGGLAGQIGKTGDGLEINAVQGAPDQTYIVLRGFMFPEVVYRDSRQPAWIPSPATIGEIQLLEPGNTRPQITMTRDLAVFEEVANCLTSKSAEVSNVDQVTSYRIYLVSRTVPSLGYALDAIIDSNGAVYLDTKLAPDRRFLAGPLFTAWVKQR
jgi:hypothetical protein